MMDLIYFTEYCPLLMRISASAAGIYSYYYKFKDENNEVKFTYAELSEHLSIAIPTLVKIHQILQKLKMIEQCEEGRFRVLPLEKIPDELKQQIAEEFNFEMPPSNSLFIVRYGEEKWPPEFQQLLSKKTLKNAKKALGDSFRKAPALCAHFGLDLKVFKVVYQKQKFQKEFTRLVKEVEEEFPKKEKPEKKFTEEARELTKYLYDKLAERDAKPTSNWWMKNCAMANALLVRDFTLEEAKKVIDWAFEDNWWKSKTTNIRVLETIRTQYKLNIAKKKVDANKITRRTPIPDLVKEALKQIPIRIPINVYEDAYFLKQNILNGEKRTDLIQAVEILEKFNVVPQGKANINF